MSARAEMLDRIRKALQRPPSGSTPAPLSAFDMAGILPPLNPHDYQAKFEAEWEKVSGIAHRVEESDHLDAIFQKILGSAESHALVLSRNPLLAELGVAKRLENAGRPVTTWSDRSAGRGTQILTEFSRSAFSAGAGITGVEYVVAETGTLVLSSATEGAQIASLAPPIHIALYRRSQLVGSLDEVFARSPLAVPGDQPSPSRSWVFITGTSRTADIEQILIRGVHGPRQVHAILVEDCCC